MKIKIEVEIDPKRIIQESVDWYGFRISCNYLQSILEKYPSVALEIHTAGFDTVAREMLADAISHDLCDMCWPINADSNQLKEEFLTKFKTAALAHDEIEIEKTWSLSG